MLFYSSFPSLSLTHHLSFLPIHLLTLTCPINNSTPSILLLFYSFLSSLNLLSMSSTRHPVAVDVGCSCGRRKPSSLFSSSSHTKSNKTSNSSSTTTSSSELTPPPPPPPPPSIVLNEGKTDSRSSSTMKRRKKKKKNKNKKEEEGRVALESIAVAVESSEPYEDFRESMVQMVVEKEIYAWDDLNDLLHQFLSLNSPRHHKLILHAFADLWNSLFSPPSPCL